MKINEQEEHQSQLQIINQGKCEIQITKESNKNRFVTGEISNNLKYIVAAGETLLQIWSYRTHKLLKLVYFNKPQDMICKFSNDLLYVGYGCFLYQFQMKNQFKKLSKQFIHNHFWIDNIYITNSIILTQSYSEIIKTNGLNKQQLLKIQVDGYYIYGLNYNKSLDIIVIGSNVGSIKLFNGNDGSLIIEKNVENNTAVLQVLFIVHDNQLVSLNCYFVFTIWNINYETKQLECLKKVSNSGNNITLFQQQYIIATRQKFIKVYTIQGEFGRQFDHGVDQFNQYFKRNHPDSNKAILILGKYKLQVCELDFGCLEIQKQ